MKKWLSLHEEKYESTNPLKTILLIIFVVGAMTVCLAGGVGYIQNTNAADDSQYSLTDYELFMAEKSDMSVNDVFDSPHKTRSYFEMHEHFPSNQDYWIKINVQEFMDGMKGKTPIIYFSHPNFMTLEAYYKGINGEVRAIHVERKLTLYPHFYLPRDMDHEEALLVKAKHIIPSYRMIGMDDYEFFKKISTLTFFLVFSFGIVFAVVVLNIVLGLYLKDRYFILHAIYLMSVLIYEFQSRGVNIVLFQSIGFDYYYWAFIGFVMIVLFTYYYLNINEQLHYFRFAYKGLIAISLFMIVASVLGYGEHLYGIGMLMGIGVPLVIMFTLVYYMVKKIYVSYYFVIGGMVLGTAEILYTLQQVGLIATNKITQYGFTYALTVEAIFFTLGILDRLKELRENNQIYYEISITDKLTKIHNRHYLDINIERIMEFCRRYEFPLTMLMFDIDHFKNVNDQHGHDVGDIVLKNLAQTINKATRQNDILIRWGGEEFLVLMPKTDIPHAVKYGEKIRCLVEESDLYKALPITISVGVAKWSVGESLDRTFKRADQALYLAKKQGRNRVVAVYEHDELSSMSVDWSDMFECGHPVIDKEHKKLLDLVKQLPQAQSDGTFLENLDILVKEISAHFRSEEEILSGLSYKDYVFHKDIHSEIEASALRLIDRYKKGAVTEEELILKMIQSYIMGHLITEDIKFFALFEDV